jgi:glycosyltransferase involved in cell wall biosynthesis
MDAPTLSLIVPLYNEAPNLPRLLEACAAALERTGESWEILLIDDGSDDGSWAVIQRATQADGRIRGLRHPQRLGKTQAYATGFRAARGQYLFTIDADLQEDPAAIPAMLERLRTDADMVVGWRRRRRDPPLKVLASWVFNARVALGLGTAPARCELRLQGHAARGRRRAAALLGARLPPLPRADGASAWVSRGGGGCGASPARLWAFPLRAGAVRARAGGPVGATETAII